MPGLNGKDAEKRCIMAGFQAADGFFLVDFGGFKKVLDADGRFTHGMFQKVDVSELAKGDLVCVRQSGDVLVTGHVRRLHGETGLAVERVEDKKLVTIGGGHMVYVGVNTAAVWFAPGHEPGREQTGVLTVPIAHKKDRTPVVPREPRTLAGNGFDGASGPTPAYAC